jgi:hypothetical protein
LYVYSAVANDFKEGWIPDNYYGEIVVSKFNGQYGELLSSLKPLNSLVFKSSAFPDILSFANGLFFDPNYRTVQKEDVLHYLFKSCDRVVYKLDNSLQGRGIFFFDKQTLNLERVKELGSGLFQSFICQHPTLDSFHPLSVATLRITSVCSEAGEPSIRACYLRFGSDNDTHVQSKSHIRVPIDIRTGTFSDVGYTTDWLEITEHPVSKKRFQNSAFPSFDAACKLVCDLHRQVPFARVIGWDIAVNEQGDVLVMEWNGGHNDIKFSEATQGPCFKDQQWHLLRNHR